MVRRRECDECLSFCFTFSSPTHSAIIGSSNDILEFKAKRDLPPIELRSGPKSYTFGGFAKALEMFHETPARQDGAENGFDDGGGGGIDDMEAFLNECEGEDERNWDDEEDDDDVEDEHDSEEEAVKAELTALAAMHEAFKKAKEEYALNGDELEQALASSGRTHRHYAAILVNSELRAIFLYELGIQFVRARLKEEPSDNVTCSVNLTKEDEDRVKTQAKELAQAFVGIRYPYL